MLRHVDLCSGIGGFSLGFEWAELSKPVLFCDIEPWSRQILAKHWPDVPIAEDVKELANDPDGLVPEARKMTDISGQKYLPLLKQSDPLGQFSKMFMATSLWVSTKCFLIWKGQATPSGRLLFRLAPLTHPTEGIEFGSSPEMWATPNTMDHLPQRSEEALKKQATTTRKGRSKPANLREQVNPETVEAWKQAQEPTMWATPSAADSMGSTGGNQNKSLRTDVKMWPTPTAHISKEGAYPAEFTRNTITLTATAAMADQGLWPTPRACTAMAAENIHRRVNDKNPNLETVVARTMWPTPTASDNRDRGHKGMPSIQRRQEKGKQLNLSMVVSEVSGSLNPQWVEWLMGYPEGWTDLED